MTTTEQLALYAQAAQAAYATGLLPNSTNQGLLVDQASMSQSQAQQFDATWNVLSQSTSSLDSFSAVLLQNRMIGEKVVVSSVDPIANRSLKIFAQTGTAT